MDSINLKKIVVFNEDFYAPDESQWDQIFVKGKVDLKPIYNLEKEKSFIKEFPKEYNFMFTLKMTPFSGGSWNVVPFRKLGSLHVPVFTETLICPQCDAKLMSANPVQFGYFRTPNLNCIKSLVESLQFKSCPRCSSDLNRTSIWIQELD